MLAPSVKGVRPRLPLNRGRTGGGPASAGLLEPLALLNELGQRLPMPRRDPFQGRFRSASSSGRACTSFSASSTYISQSPLPYSVSPGGRARWTKWLCAETGFPSRSARSLASLSLRASDEGSSAMPLKSSPEGRPRASQLWRGVAVVAWGLEGPPIGLDLAGELAANEFAGFSVRCADCGSDHRRNHRIGGRALARSEGPPTLTRTRWLHRPTIR